MFALPILFGKCRLLETRTIWGSQNPCQAREWKLGTLRILTSTPCTQSQAREQGMPGFLLFLPLHSTWPQSWHGRRQYATVFFPGQSSLPHFWHVLPLRILRGGSACFKSSPTRFREAFHVVMPRFGSVRFSEDFREPGPEPLVRSSKFIEPWTGPQVQVQ